MNTGHIRPFWAAISSVAGAVVGGGLVFAAFCEAAAGHGTYILWGFAGMDTGRLIEYLIVGDLPVALFLAVPVLQWAFIGFALYGALAGKSLKFLCCLFSIGIVYAIGCMILLVSEELRLAGKSHIVGTGLGAAFYIVAGVTLLRYGAHRMRDMFARS